MFNLRLFKKRLKSQEGMSGIIIALLLVIVGVGLIVGVNTFMQDKTSDVQDAADTAIENAIAGTQSN
jgi:hypothetical protein